MLLVFVLSEQGHRDTVRNYGEAEAQKTRGTRRERLTCPHGPLMLWLPQAEDAGVREENTALPGILDVCLARGKSAPLPQKGIWRGHREGIREALVSAPRRQKDGSSKPGIEQHLFTDGPSY